MRKKRKHLGIAHATGSPVFVNFLINEITMSYLQDDPFSTYFEVIQSLSHQRSAFHSQSGMDTMKAVGVAKYGHVDNMESRVVPRRSKPTGRDIVVK